MAKRIISRPTSFSRRMKLWQTKHPNNNSWGGNFNSINSLQGIYKGRNNRQDRYRTYEHMDLDSDVSRALDIIATHCTDKNVEGRRFAFNYETEEVTEEMSDVLKTHMDHWSKINLIDQNLFLVFRNVMKYGDWFMFRNPDTYELYDLHPREILGALVEESTQEILGWFVREFKFNIEEMKLEPVRNDASRVIEKIKIDGQVTGDNKDLQNSILIPAPHLIHFSLSEGRTILNEYDRIPQGEEATHTVYPFGTSILEKIYKTFRHIELLEQSILIHRTQRAPTRNVWSIDVGRSRPDRARQIINNFKTDLHQKRIPQFIGGDEFGVDSIYSPLSQLEDYFIPMTSDQRGSKVDQLEGTPWTNIPELDYFKTKMAKSLRVPSSWVFDLSDAKAQNISINLQASTQEEVEFSKYCDRLQTHLSKPFDKEFKLYCEWRDVNINESDFSLSFNPPTDHQASRDRARMTESINAMQGFLGVPFLSKRLIMKDVLGWSDDKIAENENMVLEEREKGQPGGQGDLYGYGSGLGASPLPPDPLAGEDGLPLSQETGPGVGGPGGLGGAGGSQLGGGLAGARGPSVGFGESKKMNKDEDMLVEDVSDDLPTLKQDTTDVESFVGLDDKSLGNDPIKGKVFMVPLKTVQELRKVELAKQIRYRKRKKVLSQIYSEPVSPDPFGGPAGGGLI